LGDAEKAAKSWEQAPIVEAIRSRVEEFEARLSESRADQSMVNPSVHYNEWNNLTPEEFRSMSQRSWHS